MSIKEKLIAGNKSFLNEKFDGDYSLYIREDKTHHGQQPYVVVITCSDSRVVPELIFNASLGDLFVIRVAGNIVRDYELSSVAYALEHLNTRCVVVLGHTNCGAIGAALSDHDPGKAEPLVTNLRRALKGAKNEEEATKINVLNSTKIIKDYFKNVKELENVEYLNAIYEIDTGKVNFF